FTDTIDLSRQVRRVRSENITTASRQWTPFSTASLLDTPTVARQFLPMSKTAIQGIFTYDNTRFRIFRWSPFDTGFSVAPKWVEYADAGDSTFQVRPGALFWIKTDSVRSTIFGGGLTVSLKQNYNNIMIKSKNWCDFAVPFRFNIRLSDIINATDIKSPGAADSLQWWKWVSNGKGSYAGVEVYNPAVGSAVDDTVFWGNLKGYTVYNPLASDVRLEIPALPIAMSPGLSKKKNNPGWRLTITAQDDSGNQLNPLYCGVTTEAAKYFLSPFSFSSMTMHLSDDRWQGSYGHALSPAGAEGVWVYHVTLGNDGAANGGTRYVIQGSGLPQGYAVSVLDGRTGAVCDRQGVESVSLAKGESKRRVVVAGPPEAVARFAKQFLNSLRSFMRISPNPSSGRLCINYRFAQTQDFTLRCRIYSLTGRIVLENFQNASSETFVWNFAQKGMAPGIYVVALSALDAEGKIIGTLKSKFTFLP
ncbi:MAG: hypothetical protein PHC61_17195, partial [Chitinivibrionales bacterium]|nr:hypothetical protein [Chitinivibrionales bacterium]